METNIDICIYIYTLKSQDTHSLTKRKIVTSEI